MWRSILLMCRLSEADWQWTDSAIHGSMPAVIFAFFIEAGHLREPIMIKPAHAAVEKIDVAYVARLAQLDLTDAEHRAFQDQLEHIVNYVREILHINVDGVEPMAHAVSIPNVFRQDEIRPGLDREVALANAPEQDGEQFLAPKIM
jgi:aspartyl-tRNA(Asn)/glutamyl-tRNA(Gln) amidotransferase subunit C